MRPIQEIAKPRDAFVVAEVPGSHRGLQVVRAPGRQRLFSLREMTVELLGLQIA
jgi:hypothetical protein